MKSLLCLIALLCASCASTNAKFDYDFNGRITQEELKNQIIALEKQNQKIMNEYMQLTKETRECNSYLIYDVK